MNNFSEDWSELELGEFCNLFYGKGLLVNNFTKSGFDVYGANGVIGKYSEYMFDLPKLIISCRGALSGVLHITSPKSYVTSNSIIIEPRVSSISNEYLKIAISVIDKSSIITGSAQPQITIQNLKKIRVPLPSLREQEAIVEKVKLGVSFTKRIRDVAASLPLLIRQERQNTINRAVRGELTGGYRLRLNSVDFSKTSLLVQSDMVGENKKRINKGIQNSAPFDVPADWVWTKLYNVASISGGVTKGRKLDGLKISVPYLRVANVQDGYLDLREVKFIDILSKELDKYKLIEGDILFTEGGDRDKLGRGTIWRSEIENCVCQNHIFRARANTSYADAEYINIYSKSEFAREYFFENATQTVNLASINLTTLSNLPMPLPPIDEQREIVRMVNAYLDRSATLRSSYEKLMEKVERLEKLIVSKAVSGAFTKGGGKSDSIIKEIERSNGIYHENTNLNADGDLLKRAEIKKLSQRTYNSKMSIKRIANVGDLMEVLEKMGGEGTPESLLLACGLGKDTSDVELFFDILRLAQNSSKLTAPVGANGTIKMKRSEN